MIFPLKIDIDQKRHFKRIKRISLMTAKSMSKKKIVSTDLSAFEQLSQIMAYIADPDEGCLWVIEQDFKDIAPYTIEEAYEVFEAIQNNDSEHIKEELGDLLLQVVFHSAIAKNKNLFEMEDVIKVLNEKLIRRHPHIFEDWPVETIADIERNWELIKAKEKADNSEQKTTDERSLIDGVSKALPALKRAQKIQMKALNSNFINPDLKTRLAKIKEEVLELEEALETQNKAHIEEEMGDLLFAISCLGQSQNIHAEEALSKASDKFENRFRFVETELKKQNIELQNATAEQIDIAWKNAKKAQ